MPYKNKEDSVEAVRRHRDRQREKKATGQSTPRKRLAMRTSKQKNKNLLRR